MAITHTGTYATGTITAVSGLAITDGSYTEGSGSATRPIALFDSSNNFKGLSWIAKVSGTTLTHEGFFDPVDNSKVTPIVDDQYDIAVKLSDIGAGVTVSGDNITLNDQIDIGAATARSSFVYAEGNIIYAGDYGIDVNSGMFVLGKSYGVLGTAHNPCKFISESGTNRNRLNTHRADSHLFMFGGSIIKEAVCFVGNYGSVSSGQHGTTLFDSVYMDGVSPITHTAGGISWGTNPERAVLRNCKFYNAFTRWGNGVVEGGEFRMFGTGQLAVFGSDREEDYDIGPGAGARITVIDAGVLPTGRPALWRHGNAVTQNLDFTNIVTSKRFIAVGSGSVSTTANGSFYFKDAYKNAVLDTKIVITKSDNTLEASGISDGVNDVELSVLEATLVGLTETVVESNWNWGAITYDRQVVSGSFSTEVVQTVSGDAKNVSHGANLLQSFDNSITENTKATVDAYTTLDNAQEFYDRAKVYLVDNYAGETETIITRSSDTIDARSYNVTIDATALNVFAFDGTTITIKASTFTGNITTTGTITLSSGAVVDGGLIDVNGDSYLTFNNVSSWNVYANEANALSGTSPIGTGVSGEIFRFNYVAATTYYLALYTTGGARITQSVSPSQSGETIVSLDTTSFLQNINDTLDLVLEDTNELQTNQGNWITATGFATPLNVTDSQTAITTEINANEAKIDTIITNIAALNNLDAATVRAAFDESEFKDKNTEAEVHAWLDSYANKNDFKTDISAIETKTQADARQALLIAEHDQTQVDISNIGSYDDTALIAKVDVIDSNVDSIKTKTDTLVNTDLTGIATSANITDSQAVITALINGLNDLSSTDITAAVPSTAQIEAALLNEGDGQQLIDAIVQAIGNSNVDEIALVTAIRSDLERAGGSLDIIDSVVDAIKVKTDTLVNTDLTGIALSSEIAALNNISAADVLVQIASGLNTYDAPTKSELDAAETVILNAISSNANSLTAQDVWDYLQTSTTVNSSMKEAIEVTLKNAKLIPAAL